MANPTAPLFDLSWALDGLETPQRSEGRSQQRSPDDLQQLVSGIIHLGDNAFQPSSGFQNSGYGEVERMPFWFFNQDLPADGSLTGRGSPGTAILLDGPTKGNGGSKSPKQKDATQQVEPTSSPSDPLYASQWHFGLIGDIEAIWDDYDGSTVHLAIYDNATEYDHPDFGTGRYDATLHFTDSSGNTYDPYPTGVGSEAHGTAVAGLAVAESDNGLGGAGVASGVTFTAVNFVDDIVANESEQTIIEALNWAINFDIMNNSWGQFAEYLDDQNLANPDSELSRWTAAYEEITELGRGGLGTVIIQSAGNGDPFTGIGVNANGDGLNVSRFTATISATDSNGYATEYTNWGTGILVAAPAAANTTDRTGADGYSTGDYTDVFGGTSAAAPVVSGVVALMLEANPDLGWRDVQNILGYSASQTGSDYGSGGAAPEITTWSHNDATTWNGGGVSYNLSYGLGMVDAYAAVRMAEAWSLFYDAPMTSGAAGNEEYASATYSGGPVAIPDYTNEVGIAELALLVTDNILIETAMVTVDITHSWGGDLILWLVSPDGEETPFYIRESDSGSLFGKSTLFGDDTRMDDGFEWTFEFTVLRGSNSEGEWLLRVEDHAGEDTGVVTGFSIEFFGSPATDDDIYHFTNDFLELATVDTERTAIDGGSGTDWINLVAVTGDVMLDLTSSADNLAVNGVVWASIAAGSMENVAAGDGNDTIIGDDEANEIHGGRGNDLMFDSGGDDSIFGAQGDDRLVNGDGDDTFDGGEGMDTLVFGGASDQFEFATDLNGNLILGKDGYWDRVGSNIEALEFDDGTLDYQTVISQANASGTQILETSGAVTLKISAANNQYVLDNGTSEVGVTFGGSPVTTDQTIIHAERSADGGYELLVVNTNGTHSVWTLDAAGAHLTDYAVSDLRTVETMFQTDLDGDGEIGLPDTLIEENGIVDLEVDGDTGQYLLVDGDVEIVITQGGVAVSPTSWTDRSIVQAESNATGGYNLLLALNSGQYEVWQVDASGDFISSYGVSDPRDIEPAFAADVDGDGTIGHPDEIIEATGSIALKVDGVTRQYTLVDGRAEIGITQGGTAITPETWTDRAITQAESNAAGGYDLLIALDNGEYELWHVETSGAYLSSDVINDPRDVEPAFGVDLDGDGEIGQPDEVIETAGSVTLKVDGITRQYIIDDGGVEIGVSLGGTPITPELWAEWTIIHAEDNANGGYDVLFLNTNGTYSVWTLDATGEHVSDITVSDIRTVEEFFEADINGDGVIGTAVAEQMIETNGSVSLKVAAGTGQYTMVDGASEIGITLNGTAITPDLWPGWSVVQAEDNASGGYEVLFSNTNGTYTVWTVDGSGSHISDYAVSDLRSIEPIFETDLDGDGEIGITVPEQIIETNGSVSLKVAAGTGQYTMVDGAGEIGITLNGTAITPDLWPGWSVVQAEDNALGGYEVLFSNTNGTYSVWTLDASGSHISDYSVADLSTVEEIFEADLDGDGEIGTVVEEVFIETNGSVSLKVAQSGQYTMVDGASEIGINLNGTAITPDLWPGWSVVQAEDNASGGYEVLFSNTNGTYTVWTVDASGSHVSDYGVSDLASVEPIFEADLNGDGEIGITVVEQFIETNGSVSLKVDSDTRQYMMVDGAAEIGINLGGMAITPELWAEWTIIQAEDNGSGGYEVLFENINGSHTVWNVDASGTHISDYAVSDLASVEPIFEADLNGDGQIGYDTIA